MYSKSLNLAGAAGFEPAITGSKPDALPLGYAPILFLFKQQHIYLVE